MARKKQEDAPVNTKAWMDTFSDLMNLLLCFFVMLFAMSDVNEEKYAALVASMQSTMSIFSGGASAIGDGMMISNGVSQLNELDQYINSTGKTADSDNASEDLQEYNPSGASDEQSELDALMEQIETLKRKAIEELSERIEETITESRMSEQIEVTVTGDYVQLSIRGGVMFDSGKSDILEEAVPVLEKVGVILERYAEDIIEIEGHTDNVPIGGDKYGNDKLSSDRALSIFRYLEENTSLDPAVIKHSGRGSYDPIADNSTEAGRARNRRVEIRIYPSLR